MAAGMTVKTANEIDLALVRSRKMAPAAAHMLALLAEEVGQVAAALTTEASAAELRRACVKVAVGAIRIMEEGDADFSRGAGGRMEAGR